MNGIHDYRIVVDDDGLVDDEQIVGCWDHAARVSAPVLIPFNTGNGSADDGIATAGIR